MNKRVAITAGGLLIFLYIFSFIARQALVGSSRVIRLGAAPPFTGQVSQGLGVKPDNTLPIAGKDYNFDPHYFDNNTWIVGSVVPLNNSLNASVVVMEKQANSYQIVLGPSGAVTSNQIGALPTDVAAYLKTKVGVYETTP